LSFRRKVSDSVGSFSPALHLHDALMALAGPSTRRRYTDAECVCVVEDALVGYKFKNLIAMMERRHCF
jgi:hypothetical protein